MTASAQALPHVAQGKDSRIIALINALRQRRDRRHMNALLSRHTQIRFRAPIQKIESGHYRLCAEVNGGAHMRRSRTYADLANLAIRFETHEDVESSLGFINRGTMKIDEIQLIALKPIETGFHILPN